MRQVESFREYCTKVCVALIIFEVMLKIPRHAVFVSVFFFCLHSATSQNVKFSIHLGGKEIGEVHAHLVKSDTIRRYEVISDVNFKVLWKEYNRQTSNTVIYQNGILVSSYNSVYMNEEMEDSSAICRHKQQYSCYRFPEGQTEVPKKMVAFSTVKLYFSEPVGISSIYSERYLAYCPLELIDDHKYKLSLPNGKKNFYTYANEKLVEVFVDRSWFDLIFLQR